MSDAMDTTGEGGLMIQLLDHGTTRPDDEALIVGETVLGWKDLRDRVLSVAAMLDEATPAGSRIALLGDVSPDLVIDYLAIVASGRCAVPLQTSAHPDAQLGMLSDCDPAALIADPAYADQLKHGLSRELPVLPTVQDATTATMEPMLADPDAAFNIIYSSGTTGRPKGIVQSHRMRFRQTARNQFGLSAASTQLLATPLYSNTTLMPMLATLFHGGRVVMMPKFNASGYLDLAERFRATHTMLVPVQYQRILAEPSFGERDLSSFELKQSTGAPLAAADKLRLVRDWPGKFLEVYGLTEGGCTCILDVTAHPDKAGTVGRPAANNDVRIIDEAGQDVPLGERGEIIGRSPMMMTEYFRRPDVTADFQWRDADGTLYHRTGDIGVFDADGFLTLVDRKKDMIISGGFNIYASDLEEQLLAHPDVAEAAVVAMPSAKWGETPLGFVTLKPGATADADAILDWANAQLGKMQRLSAVEIIVALPRNAVGKVLKQELKRRIEEKTA
ncbi:MULTISPECIES: class I adenylate-forming enzyme family protein [Mameliella]|uniref:class I adenylate-forming enzyme family protein n=1 Tax=Mameliella TaxID=1434019 RepID=UPI000B52F4FF|nr:MULTISPECIES: AMP-binding protein [Mameliella]OWV53689.1 4-coumarate--CoA ligase [Mameliella alba]